MDRAALKLQITGFSALLRRSAVAWNEDNALRLGAALSYYAVFSIGPLLILVTGLSGLIFGDDAVRGRLSAQFQSVMGADGARAVEALVASAHTRSTGWLATVVGIGALLIAATAAFSELESSLNLIWRVDPRKSAGIVQYVRARLLTFGMVLAIGLLLLVSFVINTALSASSHFAVEHLSLPRIVFRLLYPVVALGIITVLFALIFKILPNTQIRWRDVWPGSFVTATLFTVGKYLISAYVATTNTANSFGGAAAVTLIMVWAYYSSLILFFGAEFTKAVSDERTQGAQASARPTSK